MKNFPDNSAENVLKDLRGGTIQSLAIAGASITVAISGESGIFEIGSLGEVELEKAEGDRKDLFSCLIGELAPMAGSQIAGVSVNEDRVVIQIDDPSWAITYRRGVDYAIEISQIASTKGPAFFFG
jgi:hypothetical protein